MAPSRDNIIQICELIAEQENLNATVREAGKGFLIAGTSAALGALFGGPMGMFLGGTVGSATAAYASQGKFKSVSQIITEDMTPIQRQRLADKVAQAIQSISAEDLVYILPMIAQSASMKELVIKEMGKFLLNEMGMSMARIT